jgi:hypothetical protein
MKLRILPFLFLLAFAPCAHAATGNGNNLIITSVTATDEPSTFIVTGYGDLFPGLQIDFHGIISDGPLSLLTEQSWIGTIVIPGLYAYPGRQVVPPGMYTLAQVLQDLSSQGKGNGNGGGTGTDFTEVLDFSLVLNNSNGIVVDITEDNDNSGGSSGQSGGSGGSGPGGGGSTTTVPEPSTWALLLGSLAALVYYRRFRLARQIARRQ